MRCDNAKERLQEYIEGTLKSSDLRSLEEHCQSCPDCSREMDSFKELDARLRREIPQYWESIEPSPDFMARLRRLDLKAPPSRFSLMANALLALWQNHRPVLAAGLAVCLVIALSIAIPRIISQPETVPIVVERLPELAPEAEVLKEREVERVPEREVVKEMPVEMLLEKEVTEEMVAAPTEMAAGSAKALAPREAPTLSAQGIPEAALPAAPPAITNYTTEQGQLAIKIALSDSAVQEALKGSRYRITEVRKSTTAEVADSCAGPTVIIALDQADPSRSLLYVCVDLEKRRVDWTALLPASGLAPTNR